MVVAGRERVRAAERVGSYFSRPKAIPFVSSGCKTLDLALGGGWAVGRVGNIVGDKSTGKTLLCIEACANFAEDFKGDILYREAEAAFDQAYAKALGMPLNKVDFGKGRLDTVEDMFEELDTVCKRARHPTLYICDSLDALTDRAEVDRPIDQGSYGAAKAKKMSEMFRRLVRRMEDSMLTLLIVSQIRDKMNVSFGRKWSRTGGHALDFYASQVLYLAQIGTISKTIRGHKRKVGIEVRGKLEKNKIALPFREAQFDIIFGFGIDDMRACVSWLKEESFLKDLQLKPDQVTEFIQKVNNYDNDEYKKTVESMHELVEKRWWEIEDSLLPKRKKYG